MDASQMLQLEWLAVFVLGAGVGSWIVRLRGDDEFEMVVGVALGGWIGLYLLGLGLVFVVLALPGDGEWKLTFVTGYAWLRRVGPILAAWLVALLR